MSEDEKRALKAAVLLELEDAKDAMRLLRTKAAIWSETHQKLSRLLALARAGRPEQERDLTRLRMEIGGAASSFRGVMDMDAIQALDAELEAALVRLKKAESAKLEMFGN